MPSYQNLLPPTSLAPGDVGFSFNNEAFPGSTQAGTQFAISSFTGQPDNGTFGTLSNKAVSKLAGVAPLAQDSGKREGKRAVRGGRRNVRAILYVVAGVVRRYNPDFAAFAERMAAKGKPKRVIRVALAHKLLVRLNALCRASRAKRLTK